MIAVSPTFANSGIFIDESPDLPLSLAAQTIARKINSGAVAPERAKSTPKAPKAGFVPLSTLLEQTPAEQLLTLSKAAAMADRKKLINAFQTAFSAKKRLAALVLADELIRRGIPPAFQHSHLSSAKHDVNQRHDLIFFDFRWIRTAHPDHITKVRYAQYRELFTNNEAKFHKVAEYIFYGGNREPWKIVASLSLTENQQFELYRLQSAHVAKRQAATNAMRDDVFKAIKNHIGGTRRTKTFDEQDASATLFRRHRLWVCFRMIDKKAINIQRRYKQLTGEIISEDIIRRQLKIVEEILDKNRTTKTRKHELH